MNYALAAGKMRKSEEEWDKLFKIYTCGREDYQEDKAHYPYEPTPYVVLERLASTHRQGCVGILLSEE